MSFKISCCCHKDSQVTSTRDLRSSGRWVFISWSSRWRWRQHDPLKHWYPATSLHGVATHKNTTKLLVDSNRYVLKWTAFGEPFSDSEIPCGYIHLSTGYPELKLLPLHCVTKIITIYAIRNGETLLHQISFVLFQIVLHEV